MRRVALSLIAGVALLMSGCFPGRMGHANLVGALWTAAIVGTALAVAAHDAHYHYERCGHYRYWYEGRWIYWYNDHWEYYDEWSGQWYIYE